MSTLRRSERCPLHHRTDCCGRQEREMPRRQQFNASGVKRIPDESNPRGYREIRSKAAMRELLKRKVEEQQGLCALCGKPFEDFREVTPDHIDRKGMGGARKDDHPSNIQAAHGHCNSEKGSQSMERFLKEREANG